MGNPLFVGSKYLSREQKEVLLEVCAASEKAGVLDFVCGWYFKAAAYMRNTAVQGAFVSTNSITQGEQVAALWKPLLSLGARINFAHRTFRWDSEANLKAHVHCVIIGFSFNDNQKPKVIYSGENRQIVSAINAYLVDAPSVIIDRRSEPLCGVPPMTKGCQPTDGGHLIIEDEDLADFLRREPGAAKIIKRLMGSKEFINNIKRWCLWLVDVTPAELRAMPLVKERLKQVREARLQSKKEATRRWADPPHLFIEIRYSKTNTLIVPSVSSENRRYIPLGFVDGNTISTNLNLIIPDAELYHFGVLTSNVYMAWMRAVCGRLKSDYRYSSTIVYNNFPWPAPTDKQKEKISRTAQAVLDARAKYSECSLADLYDELTMLPELRTAHQKNDIAVMEAYGFDVKSMNEADCVAALMEMYQELVKAQEG